MESVEEAGWRYDVIPAQVRPLDALEEPPLDGRTTSFFVTERPCTDFVRDSRKPLEALLIGWWALLAHNPPRRFHAVGLGGLRIARISPRVFQHSSDGGLVVHDQDTLTYGFVSLVREWPSGG